jgi:carboxymethylenebutenolidase
VVASYGGRDLVFRRHAALVAEALDENGIPNDVKVYREAGHGFMNQSDEHPVVSALGRPLLAIGYQRDAAEDTWLRIRDFFARYLDGSPPRPV